MSEWQPIEAAPELEGAFMLAYSDGTVGMGWRSRSWKGRWRWSNCVIVRQDGLAMITDANPTDFSPLPTPPADKP